VIAILQNWPKSRKLDNWVCSSILVVFYCSSDIDCNNKGICKNGECECNPGWDTDEELDCTGNNPVEKVE
jgi:hypothetical protein